MQESFPRKHLCLVFVAQAIALVVVAKHNLYLINPDGVAYLQSARNYLDGNYDLAVAGYWSPLLSWLLVPLLVCLSDPWLCARLALVISGMIFSLGGVTLLSRFHASRSIIIAGALILACLSIPLSLHSITPDLMMGGIFSYATYLLLSARWRTSLMHQLCCGAMFGIAYLAKAAALPLSILVSLAFVLFAFRGEQPRVRPLFATYCGLLLIALPWILLISFKYQRPTISTVAPIAHAVEGPWEREPNGELHYTFKTLHKPDAGRLTSWEDPSNLPYPFWSPFDSAEYFTHQLLLVRQNILNKRVIWVFVIAGLLFVLLRKRRGSPIELWMWGVLPVVCNLALYLPTHADSVRYFLPSYPYFLIVVLGCLGLCTDTWQRHMQHVVYALVAGVLLLLMLKPVDNVVQHRVMWWRDVPHVGKYARELSQRLTAEEIQGPVAGGNPIGLYVAFYADQPWYGTEYELTPEKLIASDAELFVLNREKRNEALLPQLDADPRFERLDEVLFKPVSEAARFPVVAYRLNAPETVQLEE